MTGGVEYFQALRAACSRAHPDIKLVLTCLAFRQALSGHEDGILIDF